MYETDLLALSLACQCQARRTSALAHLVLGEFSQGEEGAAELLLRQRRQHIALVFLPVNRTAEGEPSRPFLKPNEMAHGHIRRI